jgi:hypothetical protein
MAIHSRLNYLGTRAGRKDSWEGKSCPLLRDLLPKITRHCQTWPVWQNRLPVGFAFDAVKAVAQVLEGLGEGKERVFGRRPC